MRALFHRLDPRARILIVLAATVIIASTPASHLLPFAWYSPFVVLLLLTGRVPAAYLARRCLAASPFILLAAGLLAIQGGREGLAAAASVALKGFGAVTLLAFLTATTSLSELLWALRRMHAPESLSLILSMMYRYTGLLSEEFRRMERARDSRTVRPLGRARYTVHGRQLATLLIRCWDRAERVHAAMLARGFDGAWPVIRSFRFTALDSLSVSLATLIFLAVRLSG